MRSYFAAIAATALITLGMASCTPNTIPGTPIYDTKDNRAVLDVLSQYQSASQALDSDGLLQLASTKYFDKSFMDRGRSPIDYAHLQKMLTDKFGRLKALKMEITPKDLHIKGDTAQVDYFMVMHFSVVEPQGEKWFSESDDERMSLAREDGGWKVVSGM
jgi:hypothetical protein